MQAPESRSDYSLGSLRRADLDQDPLLQFERWFADALQANVPEPAAMTLATVGTDGAPDARIVLLRGAEKGGFQFFTNRDSKKGWDLAANPSAALVFFWNTMERQVRIRGRVTLLDRERSQVYFSGRPRASQLGAWLSRQSEIAPDDADFQTEIEAVESRFAGSPVPLPSRWGGYHLTPTQLEFWQGRPNRLHDRFLYRRRAAGEGGGWELVRLYP